jgi:ribonuclease D
MERLTNEQVQFLPMYDGLSLDNIIVVTQKSDAISAIEELKKHSVLGFDTESKPCFKKGEISDGPHLIQLSTKAKAYLFPTKFFDNFAAIEGILSDPTIKKVGFGLKEDKKIIFRKFGIRLENTIELSSKVMHFAQVTQRVGARAAVAMFFNQRLSKGAQRSNWSVFPLKDHQKMYAANDAHSALLIELEIEKQNSDK